MSVGSYSPTLADFVCFSSGVLCYWGDESFGLELVEEGFCEFFVTCDFFCNLGCE
jgi:hypothetical protein